MNEESANDTSDSNKTIKVASELYLKMKEFKPTKDQINEVLVFLQQLCFKDSISIKVFHKDGKKEIINLHKFAIIHSGKTMNLIKDSTGTDHYFTHDGYYDGWGLGMPPTHPSDADAIRNAIEKNRQIED